MNQQRYTLQVFRWFVAALLIGLVLIYHNEQFVSNYSFTRIIGDDNTNNPLCLSSGRSITTTTSQNNRNREYDSKYGTNGNTASLIETMQVPTFSSKVRFFFIIALEGTGHHAIHQIAGGSPIATKLKKLNILPRHMKDLSTNLFDMKNGGLLTLQCASNVGSGHQLFNRGPKNPSDSVVTDDNFHHYISNVAKVLIRIENKLLTNNNTTSPEDSSDWIVPMNGFINGMSYPNQIGPCRTQNYPNLDLIYQACAAAKVDCFHVLMYRNPYSVIKSTFHKRRFNPTVLGAVHMYSNMLQVIWSQLLMHPTRTEGCLGFFDGHNNITTQHWKDRIRTLFGWDMDPADEERYESLIDRTVHNHSGLFTQTQKDKIIPRKYDPIMQTFVRLHNNVVSLCYEQYEQNQNGRNKQQRKA